MPSLADDLLEPLKALPLDITSLDELAKLEARLGLCVLGLVGAFPGEVVLVILDEVGRRIGHFGAAEVRGVEARYLLAGPCGARWKAAGRPPVWSIAAADVAPAWRRRGVARAIYKVLIRHAIMQGAAVVPHACVGGSTSGLADRVWTSICREVACERGSPPMVAPRRR